MMEIIFYVIMGIVLGFLLSGGFSFTIGKPDSEKETEEEDFEFPCSPDCLGCAIDRVVDSIDDLDEIANIRAAELEFSKDQIEGAQLEGIALEREHFAAGSLSAKLKRALLDDTTTAANLEA
jgi:ABC-type antimicrobial peptide transport system permease subunit